MASNIDIKNSPPTYAPVYNRIEFCVEETDFLPSSKTNFKYIFTVSVSTLYNGVTPSDVKFYVNAQPDTITAEEYGVKDIARYLDQYMKYRIPIPEDSNSFNAVYKGQEQFIIEYSVNIKSGWDVAGVFTEDPDGVGAVTSSLRYAWSAAFPYHEWVTQVNAGSPFNTWICNITNGANAKFLSNDPVREVEFEDIGYTYYLTDTVADIDQMRVRTYTGEDATGTLIGTFVINNTISTSATIKKVARIVSAPDNLNTIPGVQFASGSQPVITGSAKSYTIQLENSAGTVASELITWNIKTECRYETYRIHFLNKLGGWDAYSFTSYSKRSATTQRKSYTKQEPNFQVGGGVVYRHKDNGRQDYLVRSRDKVRLKSDFLTDEQQEWLKELVQSPSIYYEDTEGGSRVLKPVYMKTNTWTQLTTEHDKLFQLELEIEFGHEDIRQRG